MDPYWTDELGLRTIQSMAGKPWPELLYMYLQSIYTLRSIDLLCSEATPPEAQQGQ